ncbi:hypothetical protein [Pseudomonas aeruginosa]|uniref:hypothetical protein n=1 Tax=Pseudomonas aeruginosa TaxID=287 RepID=UPI000F6F7988|nr:hypothetical protein [Pseudomonas aeruginosa]VEF98768.1 Uncharacterised protein [Pseudomonas aeruginosa]VEF98835.1 Uncharacterised protein [Pseudomonas aeruginosa]
MSHHLKRIMLYAKRTLLGAMVAILIVFKAIDLGGAITGEVTAEQPATHLSAAAASSAMLFIPQG